ncbi:MAG: hypothetical protein ACFFDH_02330 [Promethearchaeota archaeon]
MSDRNDLKPIINKLDRISLEFNKITEDFLLELTKIKKILNYSKKEMFIPKKFFFNFLKPELEERIKLTKKQILAICEERRKYNSYYTLNSYLHKLEKNEYLISEKIKNEKYYMLSIKTKKSTD